jgi:hypothetical protein
MPPRALLPPLKRHAPDLIQLDPLPPQLLALFFFDPRGLGDLITFLFFEKYGQPLTRDLNSLGRHNTLFLKLARMPHGLLEKLAVSHCHFRFFLCRDLLPHLSDFVLRDRVHNFLEPPVKLREHEPLLIHFGFLQLNKCSERFHLITDF